MITCRVLGRERLEDLAGSCGGCGFCGGCGGRDPYVGCVCRGGASQHYYLVEEVQLNFWGSRTPEVQSSAI